MRTLRDIILLITALLTTSARAESWSTAAHLGFAVVDQSPTGFTNATGSMMFLDTAYRVSDSLDLGLRTIGQGAKRDGRELYRLGSGPLVQFHLGPRWSLHLALNAYSESGLGTTGERSYSAKGMALQVGWERSVQLADKLAVAWGGFIHAHQGEINHETPNPAAQAGRVANLGRSHGVEMALRFAL